MFDVVSYTLAKRKILLTQKKYDANLDGIIDLTSIPTITRSKLEYPTENVSFAYLMIIDKLEIFDCGSSLFISNTSVSYRLRTIDTFTDKAIKNPLSEDISTIFARDDGNNFYFVGYNSEQSTADAMIVLYFDGSANVLGSEAVDLPEDGYVGMTMLSCSGSTIKLFRIDMTTPKISVTDTTIPSGKYGFAFEYFANGLESLLTYLLAPQSPSPKPYYIIEVEHDGSKPLLAQELVEINKIANIPEFLKQEAKRYELLKAKGFTDEEIKALLGYIPQHQIDLASVTWGVFDHKAEHSTMLITITSDNLYKPGAIQKQVEHAKAKNLKVLNPPKDYREACEQYRQLKQDFPEWIAGKDNYAYQTLGYEVFDYFQIADTYYGNIVDGLKPNAYRNVPDWEMRKTLNMWKEKLEKVNVLKEETEKHLKKLKEVEKKGW